MVTRSVRRALLVVLLALAVVSALHARRDVITAPPPLDQFGVPSSWLQGLFIETPAPRSSDLRDLAGAWATGLAAPPLVTASEGRSPRR